MSAAYLWFKLKRMHIGQISISIMPQPKKFVLLLFLLYCLCCCFVVVIVFVVVVVFVVIVIIIATTAVIATAAAAAGSNWDSISKDIYKLYNGLTRSIMMIYVLLAIISIICYVWLASYKWLAIILYKFLLGIYKMNYNMT